MSQTNFVLLLMYDVPSISKQEQRTYRNLVSFLQRMGFYGLQESVYIKPLSEKSKANSLIENIKMMNIEGGNIRTLVLTHQAFCAMDIVCGEAKQGEYWIRNKNNVIVV